MNYENLAAKSVDITEIQKQMKEQSFFNNSDYVVNKMKRKHASKMGKLSYSQRMEIKKVGDEINEGWKMTNAMAVIQSLDKMTPKEYIYSMMKQGWDGEMLLIVSPYMVGELEDAVLRYYVAMK